jgi:hypothetical protein
MDRTPFAHIQYCTVRTDSFPPRLRFGLALSQSDLKFFAGCVARRRGVGQLFKLRRTDDADVQPLSARFAGLSLNSLSVAGHRVTRGLILLYGSLVQ